MFNNILVKSKLDTYSWLKNNVISKYYSLIHSNKKKVLGSNNKINTIDCITKKVIFDINGDNNIIFVDRNTSLNKVTFFIRGSGHKVYIGKNCTFNQGTIIWVEDNNCTLFIGDNTSVENAHIALTEPYSKILIGSDCMLAYDIDIRTGDSHSIIDIETEQRINNAKDIEIKNHVWIAAHARILKGVTIEENSIVATGSIVTKSVESNAIVAGSPAKVVKKGVIWNRQRIYKSS